MEIYIGQDRTVEITKEKYEGYEAARESGATNMFDVKRVAQLSGLKREEIIAIMNNYELLKKKYKDEEIEKEEREDKLQEMIDRDEV